jgi:hypothetical protein
MSADIDNIPELMPDLIRSANIPGKWGLTPFSLIFIEDGYFHK